MYRKGRGFSKKRLAVTEPWSSMMHTKHQTDSRDIYIGYRKYRLSANGQYIPLCIVYIVSGILTVFGRSDYTVLYANAIFSVKSAL